MVSRMTTPHFIAYTTDGLYVKYHTHVFLTIFLPGKPPCKAAFAGYNAIFWWLGQSIDRIYFIGKFGKIMFAKNLRNEQPK